MADSDGSDRRSSDTNASSRAKYELFVSYRHDDSHHLDGVFQTLREFFGEQGFYSGKEAPDIWDIGAGDLRSRILAGEHWRYLLSQRTRGLPDRGGIGPSSDWTVDSGGDAKGAHIELTKGGTSVLIKLFDMDLSARERKVNRLLDALHQRPMAPHLLVGASGFGKSSLVVAGLTGGREGIHPASEDRARVDFWSLLSRAHLSALLLADQLDDSVPMIVAWDRSGRLEPRTLFVHDAGEPGQPGQGDGGGRSRGGIGGGGSGGSGDGGNGGGGGNGGEDVPPEDGLTKRVEALEKKLDADVATLRGDIRELRLDLASLNKSVSEVSGKVSQLPSLLAIAGLVLPTIVASMIGLAGLVYTIAKVAGPAAK